MLLIEREFNNRGFLKAKVLPPELVLSNDKSAVNITYRIIEGPKYYLGALSIEGDLIENDEERYVLEKKLYPKKNIYYGPDLLRLISQKPGEVFNKTLMAENVAAIAEKYYKDEGYAYVNLSPVPRFDEENHRVDIDIQVESGPLVYIERIDIEGNEKTIDEVIRRELVIFEGKLYSSSLLQLSEQNLIRLGYFESVEFSSEPGSAPDKIVIKIKVKEQSTGNVNLGAGYGTGGEGFVFKLQLSDSNFAGTGKTVAATVNWSNYRRMFDLMLIEPYAGYIFDQPLSLAVTAFNRDVSMGEYSRGATGGDITLGYPMGGPFAELSKTWKKSASASVSPYIFDFEALWFYLSYTAEKIEIGESDTNVRLFDLHKGEARYTTSIKPSIRLDQRDNRLFPTRGIYAEFKTELASEYLGSGLLSSLENSFSSNTRTSTLKNGRNFLKPEAGANNFVRYGANLRLYHNLDDWSPLKGLVLKSNFEIGWLNTFGTPLIFENFSLGGINSIRGYSYRSISPVISAGALFPFDSRRDVAIGGNEQFHGSFELEFPLIKFLKISGVLFFDFGNVFSHEDNFFYIGGKSPNAARINPTDPLGLYNALGFLSGGGFGLRWAGPLGLLRFEWGIPLNIRPSNTPGLLHKDRPMVFELNIGPSFKMSTLIKKLE